MIKFERSSEGLREGTKEGVSADITAHSLIYVDDIWTMIGHAGRLKAMLDEIGLH